MAGEHSAFAPAMRCLILIWDIVTPERIVQEPLPLGYFDHAWSVQSNITKPQTVCHQLQEDGSSDSTKWTPSKLGNNTTSREY
eukprot:2607402-Rhodomonas_salina.4